MMSHKGLCQSGATNRGGISGQAGTVIMGPADHSHTCRGRRRCTAYAGSGQAGDEGPPSPTARPCVFLADPGHAHGAAVTPRAGVSIDGVVSAARVGCRRVPRADPSCSRSICCRHLSCPEAPGPGCVPSRTRRPSSWSRSPTSPSSWRARPGRRVEAALDGDHQLDASLVARRGQLGGLVRVGGEGLLLHHVHPCLGTRGDGLGPGVVRHRDDDEVRPYLLKQLFDVGEARHAVRVRHGKDRPGSTSHTPASSARWHWARPGR